MAVGLALDAPLGSGRCHGDGLSRSIIWPSGIGTTPLHGHKLRALPFPTPGNGEVRDRASDATALLTQTSDSMISQEVRWVMPHYLPAYDCGFADLGCSDFANAAGLRKSAQSGMSWFLPDGTKLRLAALADHRSFKTRL